MDNLAFCVGEPGDGILVGRPLYVGFFPDIQARAKSVYPSSVPDPPYCSYATRVKVVLVDFGSVDPTSAEAVSAYEKALLESNKNGTRIRAILLASPHNPLGRPYAHEALVAFFQLCSKYSIHLISDEVYAKSHFPSTDVPDPPPFVSVLSFKLEDYIDPALVHVIYALSKDFCANGIRIGALLSPFNPQLMRAFRVVASFTRVSQLAEHVWLNILNDTSFLDSYFPQFQARMTDAYEHGTSFLKANKIPYTPASVSGFIWMDLSRYLREDSPEAELELNWRMAKAWVWLAMGASFGSEKNGNFRMTFATPREELQLGMDR